MGTCRTGLLFNDIIFASYEPTSDEAIRHNRPAQWAFLKSFRPSIMERVFLFIQTDYPEKHCVGVQ